MLHLYLPVYCLSFEHDGCIMVTSSVRSTKLRYAGPG